MNKYFKINEKGEVEFTPQGAYFINKHENKCATASLHDVYLVAKRLYSIGLSLENITETILEMKLSTPEFKPYDKKLLDSIYRSDKNFGGLAVTAKPEPEPKPEIKLDPERKLPVPAIRLADNHNEKADIDSKTKTILRQKIGARTIDLLEFILKHSSLSYVNMAKLANDKGIKSAQYNKEISADNISSIVSRGKNGLYGEQYRVKFEKFMASRSTKKKYPQNVINFLLDCRQKGDTYYTIAEVLNTSNHAIESGYKYSEDGLRKAYHNYRYDSRFQGGK